MNDLRNLGSTADPSTPLPLTSASHPPAAFPDLADIKASFYRRDDAFLVGERDSCLIVTLNTATNMPEALAFYDAIGYRRTRRESRPDWGWTLQHFEKVLPHSSARTI